MGELNNKTTFEITTGTIVKTILIIAAFVFVYILRDIVLIVLTAIVVASAMEPGTKWLVARRIPRVFSVVLIYFVIGICITGIFYLFIPLLLQDASEFLSAVPQYIDSISLWNSIDSQGAEASKQIATDLSRGITDSGSIINSGGGSIKETLTTINEALSNSSGGFVKVLSVIFGGALGFILIVALSFYFAVQEDGVEKFLRIVTPAHHEKYIIGLWKRTREKIGLWMQGQIVLAIIVGVLVYLGLTILGVKNALLFAFLAALFEIIPLFGPLLAAVPAVATAYSESGVAFALIVTGLYLIIQQFENHLIYPLVFKKIVGVHPILVILSLIVGFELAGFLGMILAVPVAAMLVEFLDDIQKIKRAQV